jgi:hypothetical protein
MVVPIPYRNAASIVRSRIRQTLGLPATLSRGGQSCSITVGLGQSGNRAFSNQDIKIESDQQDFFISASDYAPTGTPSEPVVDDRITIVIGTSTCIFEVRPVDDQNQPFGNDRLQTEFRVRTKLVSKV